MAAQPRLANAQGRALPHALAPLLAPVQPWPTLLALKRVMFTREGMSTSPKVWELERTLSVWVEE